ncbi:hypothetical protein EVAR_19281_1 [Eumeta japonica]|uniref:Uncharacterized protein n=1 Tax=Eumeta variegata TaxID=151549 RepID=A0A4C1UEM9_EUMVA|nr:hypothetical protein EVAR_19281_1 [Eumeta japonica]
MHSSIKAVVRFPSARAIQPGETRVGGPARRPRAGHADGCRRLMTDRGSVPPVHLSIKASAATRSPLGTDWLGGVAERHSYIANAHPGTDVTALHTRSRVKHQERGARRPYISYGSFVWNMGVCGACEADGGRGCPTWPVIQRASMNASLFGSSGHLGASLQRSLGRTSFVLDVLHTAVFTSWKVAGMYSASMIQLLDYS